MDFLDPRVLSPRLELLNPAEFVALCNDLLVGIAISEGIDRSLVRTNLHIHEKDGGIDARCDEVPRTVGTIIPRPNTDYQFKAGRAEKSPNEVAKEDIAEKSRVLDGLRAGHALVYITAGDRGDAYEGEIVVAAKKLGVALSDGQLKYVGGGALAQLICRIPKLAARVLHVDNWLRSLKDWSDLPSFSNAFQVDDRIRARMEDLRQQIERPGSVVRIAGAAGNGKTRTVLESLRGSVLESSVLYAEQVAELPAAFVNFLKHTPDVFCTVVVDEVDEDDAEHLSERFARMPPGVRLVMIGVDADRYQPAGTVQIEGLSQDLLVAAVKAIVDLPDEEAREIASVCENSPKMAFVIATRVRADRSLLDHGRRLMDGRVRSDLRRYLGIDLTSPQWQALSAVALLTRVGWTGEAAVESEGLFESVGLDPGEARTHVEELHRRLGIAPIAGHLRYVSPGILADFLATEWLNRATPGQLERLWASLSHTMADSFGKRIKRFGAALDNRRIVEEVILGNQGPFRSLADVESGRFSMFLRHLALALPHATLAALKRVIEPASEEELRAAKRCRRDLVVALEDLLWSEITFPDAAQLLLQLAVAENETWANNATGTWVETFQTWLGRTFAGLEERRRVLTRAIVSRIPEERRLAALALAAALKTNHLSRMGRAPRDAEGVAREAWSPRRGRETVEAIMTYLDTLRPLLQDDQRTVRAAAAQALAEATDVALLSGDVLKTWSTYARLLRDAEYDVRSTIVDSIDLEFERIEYRRQATDSGNDDAPTDESPEVKARLDQLAGVRRELIGEDFSSRFRKTISSQPWAWREGERQTKQRDHDEQLRTLARSVIDAPALLNGEWDWLSVAKGNGPEIWFDALGETDSARTLTGAIEEAVRKYPRAVGWSSLYDLGNARAHGDPSLVVKRAKDLLVSGASGERVLDLLTRAEPSSAILDLVFELFETARIPGTSLSRLAFGRWLSALSPVQATRLLRAASIDPAAAANVIDYLSLYLHAVPGAKDALRGEALAALARPFHRGDLQRVEWEWGQVAGLYVEGDPASVATATLNLMGSDARVPGRELVPVVRRGWELSDKDRFFYDVLAPWVEDQRVEGWAVRQELAPFDLSGVDIERLGEWVRKNREVRARGLAEVIGAPVGHPSAVHAMLLEHFEDTGVGTAFFGNLISGVFMGSAADRTRGLITTARRWLDDERPAIQAWARQMISELEAMLAHDETREAEERFR